MNWKSTTPVALLAISLTFGCNSALPGTSSGASAEQTLSQLKSFGLKLTDDNVMPPKSNDSWSVHLTDHVGAQRQVSPQAAEDFCWVQKNRISPRPCVVKDGWTVTWGEDTSPAIVTQLKQL